MRSPVAVDHLELVLNGEVLTSFKLSGDRRRLDASGRCKSPHAGWLILRAWNDGADPHVLDIYPYATTSPIYLDLPGGLPPDREERRLLRRMAGSSDRRRAISHRLQERA